MSALQPFRQRLAAISQSSTAIVELTNRFEVRSLQHRLWSFDHLIESIAQDGFDCALEQAQSDPTLYEALLKSRHHYRSDADIASWVVGWRNQCFLDGQVEVVIASDAWLLKHSHPHLARINRPNRQLSHRWAMSLDRGDCTAISIHGGQVSLGFSEGSILRLDLETGAVLQERQVKGDVQCLVGFGDGLIYSTAHQTVCWIQGPVWSTLGATQAVFDSTETVVFLAMSDGTICAFQVADGFCLAQLKSNLQVAQLIWSPEHLYIRSVQGRLWRVSNPLSSSKTIEWAELKAPILELVSIELNGHVLMVADALGGLAFWDLNMSVWTQAKLPLAEGLQAVFWSGTDAILAVSNAGALWHWTTQNPGLLRLCEVQFGAKLHAAYDMDSGQMIHATREQLVVFTPTQPVSQNQPLSIQQMRVSDDGALLACLTEGERLEFIDVYAERQFPALQADAAVSAFYPDPQNSRFIFRDGSCWRQNGTELEKVSSGDNWIRTSALGPDGLSAILTLEGHILVSQFGQTTTHTPPSAAVQLTFTPNGTLLMVALAHGGLWSIQLSTQKTTLLITGLKENIKSMVFSRDSRWLLVCGSKGALGLWNMSVGGWLWRIRWRRTLVAACFSSDSKFLYLSSANELVVFARAKGKVINRTRILDPAVDMVSLSGDRLCLAAHGALHFFQWRQPNRRLC